VLEDCDNLTFSLFRREPVTSSFDLLPAAKPEDCKAVRISWTASREFVEKSVNAQNTISATIVLRMK